MDKTKVRIEEIALTTVKFDTDNFLGCEKAFINMISKTLNLLICSLSLADLYS